MACPSSLATATKDAPAPSSSSSSSSSYVQEWIQEQESLKKKLLLRDNFTWTVPSSVLSVAADSSDKKDLRYIGGVDVSFLKEDPSTACAALVIIDANTMDVVHEEFDVVRLQIPYIPGFLAFREAPILLGLLDRVKQTKQTVFPQLLMVDGNGLLHPRGFGLACQLGVLADIPSIGIGKNLHNVDGLSQSGVKKLLEAREHSDEDVILLAGESGQVWGAAMRCRPGSSKPIFVSIGHRISLDSSIKIVKLCCKFRVPEPIRQADIRSRAFIRRLK